MARGGRITDDKDMRTSDIIVMDLLSPKVCSTHPSIHLFHLALLYNHTVLAH